MSSWHSYPSVFALGHKMIEELFLDPVVIQEKVDGSQLSFGMFGGELKVKSHHKEIIIGGHDKMWNLAIETIERIRDKLHDGWTYRGEYLMKPKHNVLAYNRVPVGNIVIFDINDGEESYLPPENVAFECGELGLEYVYTFGKYFIHNTDEIKELLDRESFLGGTKVEGIVFKNYNRFGRDKKALMGKYVSEAFKEVHQKEWKANNPGRVDTVIQIIDELKTDARREKAVQHLKEKGELEQSPKDIGKLMAEVKADIEKECKEYIIDRLYKNSIGHILRGVVSGFPEWYKNKLAENQFKGE
jgi:hypothetical protein